MALVATLPFTAGCSRASKISRKLESARDYLGQSNFAAAEIEYRNLLELEPNHPQAFKGLGLIRVQQGAMLEGGRLLSSAKQKLPADDEIGVNLALSMAELGFVGDSRKALLEVLDRNPSHGDALVMLAETAFTPEALAETEVRIALAKDESKAPVLLASAIVELRREHMGPAEEMIVKAVKLDPGSARALAVHATVLKLKRQSDSALATMSEAAALAGPRSREADAYAKWLMEIGRRDEALAFLEKAIHEAPDSLPKWRILGQIEFAAGNDAKAAECFSKVLAGSPLDIETGLFQAQLWLRHDEAEKAANLLEQISKTFPSRPMVEVALARSRLATGDSRSASETLDRLLAIVPGLAEAVILRTRIDLNEKRPEEAILRIEPLAKAEPQNTTAQELLIEAYRTSKRTDDAITLLRQLVVRNPGNPALCFQLGELLRLQGKSSEGRTVFEQTLKLDPEHLGAISHLAAMDMNEGNAGNAMARAEQYLSTHPDSPEGNLLKAGLSYAAKDFGTAESLVTKTLRLQPDALNALALLVRIQTDDGRTDEAAENLRKFVHVRPDNVAARMHLGSLLQQAGRSSEAHAAFEEIIRLSPEFAPAYNNLAVIESTVPGELDNALKNAHKARELAPADPSVCDTLGWVEWLRGNYPGALALLREAAAGLSENASVRYHLAMADYMMARIPDAIGGFEKALSMQGDFPERTDAENRLAVLRELDHMEAGSLEDLLNADPKDVVLLLEQARRIAITSRRDEAFAVYEAALTINPRLEAAHLGKAKLYLSAENQDRKAFESATAAREIAPQSPHAAAVLGAVNFRMGNHDPAYGLLKEAAIKLPDDARVTYDYAWAAYSMGQVEEARTAMAKVAESPTEHSQEARQFLQLTAPDAIDSSETTALTEATLERTPDSVPALMASAAFEARAGNPPVEIYRKVIGHYPNFDPARKALARICLDITGNLDEAEKLAAEARARLKEDSEITSILGIVNHRKGKHEYAAQLLGELASKRPLGGPELLALGLSQAAIKRTVEARRNLEEAIRCNLSAEEESAARRAIAQLDATKE
jgi:tetratricopeptide (TPR) repeat protein